MPSNTFELSGEISVGDTVIAHGQTWACESVGWWRVDTRPDDDLHP